MAEALTDPSGLNQQQWEKMYRVLGGHICFQVLSAAVRLNLFEILKQQGPLTRSEIAARLGIEDKPARILLLGCAALELVEKSGEKYANSELANRLLVRDMPFNIVPIIEWQHFINYRSMYMFFDAIRENKNVGLEVFEGDEDTLYGRLAHDPTLEAIFQQAMEAISTQAKPILAENVDFSQFRCLVDVGGGNGSNIITLAQKHPELGAVVFESPSVCAIARDNIQKAGLSDRLGAVPGNCFEDPFPEQADCILFCHFFTIWSEERNQQLLKKAFETLKPGGKVMVFNMMQSDDECGPLTSAIASPYFLTLATGEGMLYTWSEYVAWMELAGFTNIKTQRLPRDHGIVIGTKA